MHLWRKLAFCIKHTIRTGRSQQRLTRQRLPRNRDLVPHHVAQASTHSSQMNTLGPAINCRTLSCGLAQKEHRRFVTCLTALLVRLNMFVLTTPFIERFWRSAASGAGVMPRLVITAERRSSVCSAVLAHVLPPCTLHIP